MELTFFFLPTKSKAIKSNTTKKLHAGRIIKQDRIGVSEILHVANEYKGLELAFGKFPAPRRRVRGI